MVKIRAHLLWTTEREYLVAFERLQRQPSSRNRLMSIAKAPKMWVLSFLIALEYTTNVSPHILS